MPVQAPITILDKGDKLPELKGERIEQQIGKLPDRTNVSYLLSRNRDTNLTRTPSFMKELDRDNSRLTINPELDSLASASGERDIEFIVVVKNESKKRMKLP